MHRIGRFASLLGVTAALAWIIAPPGVAQTRTPHAPDKPPQTVPEARGSGSSNEPLSDKLDRSSGVIKPPAHIDPGIAKTPPQRGAETTPVIPPPGTPGGKPGAEPK
jgi:hypothetical protein